MIQSQDRSYTVYVHTAPNGKKYVGITRQHPEKRWKGGNGYKAHSPYFYSAIKKYGWSSFNHEIVASGLTKQEAEAAEISLISVYKSNDRKHGYNIENGGNTTGKHSEITRLKISKALKGHQVSEATRKRLSEVNMGVSRPLSESHKEALRRANTGKKASEETRRKLSESHKGYKWTEEQREKQRKVHTGKQMPSKHIAVVQIGADAKPVAMFLSLTAAEVATGIKVTNISSVCKGKRKRAGGFSWRYAAEIGGGGNNSN